MVKSFKVTKQINKSKIYNITSIKKETLINFYKKNFKKKFYFIRSNWHWLYRTNFNKKISSLSIFFNKSMIGHAGTIPFEFIVDKKKYVTSWFVDFIIDSNLQKTGLGTNLAKYWTKKIDIGFTFCNKKSLNVFKKNNWVVRNNFYIFFLFLNPFNYFNLTKFLPKKIRLQLNKYFFYIFKKLNFIRKKKIIFLHPSKKNFQLYICKKKKLNYTPIRNMEYFNWRILQSPYFNQYRLISFDDKKNFLLIKLKKSKEKRFIEVLFYSSNNDISYLHNILLSLSEWGHKNNYTHMKILLDAIKIKKIKILFFAKRKLNFAFFTKNLNIKKKLERNNFNFHLIDSDFEFLS